MTTGNLSCTDHGTSHVVKWVTFSYSKVSSLSQQVILFKVKHPKGKMN